MVLYFSREWFLICPSAEGDLLPKDNVSRNIIFFFD